MREETKRRFEQAMARRRLRILGVAGLAAVLVIGLAMLWTSGRTIKHEKQVAGTVQRAIWNNDSITGARIADFEVLLENGKLVRIGTPLVALPKAGSSVQLIEQTMGSGWRRYQYVGPSTAPKVDPGAAQ